MNHEHSKNEEILANLQASIDSKCTGYQLTITNNPFDVLNNMVYTQRAIEQTLSQTQKSLKEDNYFMSSLIKVQGQASTSQPKIKTLGIFKKMQVFCKNEISFSIKKYFKFPFDYNIKNDDSDLYHKIHRELLQALSFVYSNYRRFNESFKVKVSDGLICFDKIVKATKYFEKIFRQNDIVYNKTEEYLIVCPEDITLVYDVIMNIEIVKGASLPFIVSEYEFDTAIIYHTSVEIGPVVRMGTQREYSYYIHGPLYSGDYALDDTVEVKYIE